MLPSALTPYLPTNIERAAGPVYFDGLRILASGSRGIGCIVFPSLHLECSSIAAYSGIRTFPTTLLQVLAEALDRA
jgi:hypothetical protein